MKKIFSKIGILAILIFSFLLSFFQTMPIKAAENIEMYDTYIELTSIKRENNTITFTTKDKYNVMDITYVYTAYHNDVLVSNLVKRTSDYVKIDDYTYSFDVKEESVGVKIWKVRYLFTDKTWSEDVTTGDYTYVGNIKSKYRMNYAEIKNGILVKGNVTAVNNYYYFNFADLVVDEITEATIEYITYVRKLTGFLPFGWTSESISDYKNVEWEVTYDDVYYDFTEDGFFDSIKCSLGSCDSNNYRYRIVESDLAEYQWKIVLPDDEVLVSNPFTQKEVVTEKANVLKISYWSEGSYFEDVEVLGKDTGWIKYVKTEEEETWWDRLKDLVKKIFDFFGGNVIAVIITFVITIIIIVALIKIGIKKIFQAICWLIEKIVEIILKILKWILMLPFIIIKKIFGKKQE